jgi:hypothetical protein
MGPRPFFTNQQSQAFVPIALAIFPEVPFKLQQFVASPQVNYKS